MKYKSIKSQSLFAISLLISLLVASQIAKAVESTTAVTSAPRLLFRTLGVGFEAGDIFYVDSNKLKPCAVDSQRRSAYYKYTSSETPLVFARVVKTADGKEQSVPIGQANIDPSLRRALLVFSRSSLSKDGVQIMTLRDDASSVPPGGYRILNLSPLPSEVSAGTEKQIIPPGGSAVINPQPLPQRNVYEFKVFGLAPSNPIPLYSNVFGIDKNQRYMVLIVPAPESPNKMEVKFLGESVNAIQSDN